MLSREENELLTRVGPGTPMGSMMRRYWVPVLLSEELPEPDGTPIRVRLLGEDLVAFRDTQQRVGLLDEACAHRCASLAYGRNDEGGLRCIYHGWKYDVHGNVLETPAEPAVGARHASPFRDRIKHLAYPTREAAGVIWTYMGPAEAMPPFPSWEWLALPRGRLLVTKIFEDCSYAQGVEGSIDSAHSDYLHSSDIFGRPKDHAPRLEPEDTPYGFRYAAIRRMDADANRTKYVRLTLFAFPFYCIIPPFRKPGEEVILHQAWVPIDDEHNWFFTFAYNRLGPLPETNRDHAVQFGLDRNYGRPLRRRENTHLQDRAAMKAGNWSGIMGVNSQDFTMVESMGPVAPRYKEHLGASDVAVIRMRRRMLEAVRAFMDGADPPGLDPSLDYGRIASEERVVPIDVPWQEVAERAGAAVR
jgi:phthalate 4,5-dioxygenase oxygenase subunit